MLQWQSRAANELQQCYEWRQRVPTLQNVSLPHVADAIVAVEDWIQSAALREVLAQVLHSPQKRVSLQQLQQLAPLSRAHQRHEPFWGI